MVRATSALILVAMLLSFAYGTASARSTTVDEAFATEARTVLSGYPTPRLNSETTSASVVLLPPTGQGPNAGTIAPGSVGTASGVVLLPQTGQGANAGTIAPGSVGTASRVVLLPLTGQGANAGTIAPGSVGTASRVVLLPSTSTAPTGPDVSLALLVLGLAGTAGAFALAQRRRLP